MDRRNEYTYLHTHGWDEERGAFAEWQIVRSAQGFLAGSEEAVWSFPFKEEHWGLDEPPIEVRAKYEELIGFDPDYEEPSFASAVEILDDGGGGGFNQPCAYGNLCAGHAVYCHNGKWLYAPRKCRRSWYSGGAVRDEDCPGFLPNPHLAQAIEAGTAETETGSVHESAGPTDCATPNPVDPS